jgi:hypothetical protein
VTPQELIARAEDLLDAYNHRDVDRIVAAFSHEVCLGGARTGREAIRADAEQRFAADPQLRLQAVRTLAFGNIVVQEWSGHGSAGVTIADYDLSGRISALTRYGSFSGPGWPPTAL